MKRLFAFLVSVTCLGASLGAEKRGDVAPPLAFGEVFDGRVFAVQDDAVILEIDWRGEQPQDRVSNLFPIAITGDFPPRWKIAFGWLVMTHVDADDAGRGIRWRAINTLSVPLVGPESKEKFYQPGWGTDVWADTQRNNLIWFLYDSMRRYVNYRDKVEDDKYPFSKYEFFFDLVPEKLGVCRYFVLASESLQTEIEETRRRHGGKPWLQDQTVVFAASCDGRWEQVKDPLKPMLGVWLKDKRGQWALVDKIKDPCFNERFHVFVVEDDWYFVTDSGKVFLSKKPDKDGDRKLEAVWDDARRPVVAAVTDADADKTFLFGRPSDANAKPFYFELAEKPKPAEFDADAIKPPLTVPELKAPEPLKTVMAYARFLADQKEIQLPDKGGKEKDK